LREEKPARAAGVVVSVVGLRTRVQGARWWCGYINSRRLEAVWPNRSADHCGAWAMARTNRVSFPGQDNETAKASYTQRSKRHSCCVAARSKSQMSKRESGALCVHLLRARGKVSLVAGTVRAVQCLCRSPGPLRGCQPPCRTTPIALIARGVWPHMACCEAPGRLPHPPVAAHDLHRAGRAAVRVSPFPFPWPTPFNSMLSTGSHLTCSCLLACFSSSPRFPR
jgi:hypothetical protein